MNSEPLEKVRLKVALLITNLAMLSWLRADEVSKWATHLPNKKPSGVE